MPPKSVALYRGEKAERLQLRCRFEPVVSNYKRFVNKTMVFTGWNLSVSHIIIPLPWMLQAPRLFTGQIQLGAVTQSVAAFGAIQDALSFFRNSYDVFAGYRASIIRLHGLVTANEQSRALPKLTVDDQHRRRDRTRRRRGPQSGRRAADQRPEPAAGSG